MQYDIEKLSDFLRVPVEKLPICLGEFQVWLSLARDAKYCGVTYRERFKWIDDGKTNVNMSLTFKTRTPNEGGVL